VASGQDDEWITEIRDLCGYPVKIQQQRDEVILIVARTAPRGRIRLGADERAQFVKAYTEAERRAGQEAGTAVLPAFRVKITVTLDCGHVLTYMGEIEEKYPFWCEECGVVPVGKYPWTLATEIVAAPANAVTLGHTPPSADSTDPS
jgi:hypothetical protein